MNSSSGTKHPEPVPPASQLAVQPFLGALAGFLKGTHATPDYRLTMHRVMFRAGEQYLQQVTNYVGRQHDGVGRVLSTSVGIIGEAYRTQQVTRTRHFNDRQAFDLALSKSMAAVNEEKKRVPLSYLAIPFGGSAGNVVLVLYADSYEFNRFGGDELCENLVAMCRGYTEVVDTFQVSPLGLIKNFPLPSAQDAVDQRTVYREIQESVSHFIIPRFTTLSSFNFETTTQ